MHVRFCTLAGVAAAAAAAAATARAEPVSLQHLLDSREAMTAGNLNFTFTHFASQDFDPGQIMVQMLDNGNGEVGIRLSHNWEADPNDPGLRDFFLHFTVQAANSLTRIVGDSMGFNAAAGMENSFARLNEGVWGADGERRSARYLVAWGENGDLPDGHTLMEEGHDYGEAGEGFLFVAQDGWLFASPGGLAEASYIERTFQTVVMPLPTAGTAGLAGLALLASRRRRR